MLQYPESGEPIHYALLHTGIRNARTDQRVGVADEVPILRKLIPPCGLIFFVRRGLGDVQKT